MTLNTWSSCLLGLQTCKTTHSQEASVGFLVDILLNGLSPAEDGSQLGQHLWLLGNRIAQLKEDLLWFRHPAGCSGIRQEQYRLVVAEWPEGSWLGGSRRLECSRPGWWLCPVSSCVSVVCLSKLRVGPDFPAIKLCSAAWAIEQALLCSGSLSYCWQMTLWPR